MSTKEMMKKIGVLRIKKISNSTMNKAFITGISGQDGSYLAGLLNSKNGQILESLDRKHDLILLDIPPLLSVTDAVALAPQMDGVLVVIKPGKTKSGILEQLL